VTSRNRENVVIIFLICLTLVAAVSLVNYSRETVSEQGEHQVSVYKHIYKTNQHTRHLARASTFFPNKLPLEKAFVQLLLVLSITTYYLLSIPRSSFRPVFSLRLKRILLTPIKFTSKFVAYAQQSLPICLPNGSHFGGVYS